MYVPIEKVAGMNSRLFPRITSKLQLPYEIAFSAAISWDDTAFIATSVWPDLAL